MTRLTSATILTAVVLVIDATANAQQWASQKGWDDTASLVGCLWVFCLILGGGRK